MGKFPNSGIISKNDRKKTDKHPDYTGSAEVDNVEYWVSGWINESPDGRRYLKLSFTQKDETSQVADEDPFL